MRLVCRQLSHMTGFQLQLDAIESIMMLFFLMLDLMPLRCVYEQEHM